MKLIGVHFVLNATLLFCLCACAPNEIQKSKEESKNTELKEKLIFQAPDTSQLGESLWDQTVLYGARLMRHTAYFIGPAGTVSHNLNNKMDCNNCHLDGGSTPFGLNFFNSHKTYPQYRAREDQILSLADRVNNCITRPHSGRPLALDSKEMLAFISYIKWLGNGYDSSLYQGYGLKPIKNDQLRADVIRGESIYVADCQTCHGANGEGKWAANGVNYEYPPLWGTQSYQEGSSMHRVLKAASFIRHNMPRLKASYNKPYLNEQQALDVAAFINSTAIHSRPKSKYTSYPNIKTKPVDYFKGPYLDGFSEDQHTFGPWYEIKQYYISAGLEVH